MTIGAHGVNEPRNETFTPINFEQIYSSGTKVDAKAGTTGQTSAEGKALEEQALASAEALAAPEAGDARPATVPTAPPAETLTDENAGDLTVSVGSTQLTVTAAGVDQSAWTGFYVYSEPQWIGWSKPNSSGQFDVRLPDGLEAGGAPRGRCLQRWHGHRVGELPDR